MSLIYHFPQPGMGSYGKRISYPMMATGDIQSSIYEIYKPVGIVGKYLGLLQMPNVYENSNNEESKIRRIILDKILPLISLLFQIFAGFNLIYLMLVCTTQGTAKGVSGFAIIAVDFVSVGFGPIINIIFFFRSSKKLVKYLRAHGSVEILLIPMKFRLRHYTWIGFMIVTVALIGKACCVIYRLHLRVTASGFQVHSIYSSATSLVILGVIVGVCLMNITEAILHFTYIIFHHVLKVGFDQLVTRIKTNKQTMEDAKSLATTVKINREIYQELCQLTELLNDFSSPILFVAYAFDNLAVITIISMVINNITSKASDWESSFTLLIMFAVHTSFVIMFSIFAKATTSSASDVMPSIFNTMEFERKDANAEVEVFALRAQCKKPNFTASGFFQINMGILTTIVGAVASYVVIMIQFPT
ncbi:hypothetical protein CHUAL_009918 [Chamberlinius hualienensis]